MKKRIPILVGLLVLILAYVIIVNSISDSNSVSVSDESAYDTTSKTHVVTATPYRKSINDLKVKFLNSDFDNGLYTVTYKITNNGKESFKYIKVKIYYLDTNKEVLTSDWTYAVGSEGIGVGDSQEFDVMTKAPSSGDVEYFRAEIIEYD